MFTGSYRVKLITFAAWLTAFNGVFRHFAWLLNYLTWRNCQSAPSEGRQHLNHRTFVEHYRLPDGAPHRIRVDQER